MIIAIDYDGTIADTNTEKSKWIKEHLNREIPPWDCDRTDCVPLIGEASYVEMGDYVYGREATMIAGRIPGSDAALRFLAQRHTLYILSARGDTRLEYAKERLQQRGIYGSFAGFTTSSGTSKAMVCHELGADVLIDDDPRHLLDPDLEHIHRVLIQYGRSDTPELPKSVHFCPTWERILEFITDKEEY